jgi:hypothetical protein
MDEETVNYDMEDLVEDDEGEDQYEVGLREDNESDGESGEESSGVAGMAGNEVDEESVHERGLSEGGGVDADDPDVMSNLAHSEPMQNGTFQISCRNILPINF